MPEYSLLKYNSSRLALKLMSIVITFLQAVCKMSFLSDKTEFKSIVCLKRGANCTETGDFLAENEWNDVLFRQTTKNVHFTLLYVAHAFGKHHLRNILREYRIYRK